ncbi:hypothetical protein Syun_009979 [Stephania yunnanensis]|uniref:Uncharacterized protein n=1 Tax=Stephania yunnanensis TaxID=152371 RepID=A0AAP0KGM9_9MAGN
MADARALALERAAALTEARGNARRRSAIAKQRFTEELRAMANGGHHKTKSSITSVGRGLDRALAIEMARRGHTVFGFSRDFYDLESLGLILYSDLDHRHILFHLDVRDDEVVSLFVHNAIGLLGKDFEQSKSTKNAQNVDYGKDVERLKSNKEIKELNLRNAELQHKLRDKNQNVYDVAVNEVAERLDFFAIAVNMAPYLILEMHESYQTPQRMSWTTWIGASYILTPLGAFFADAYLGRFKTIVSFSCIYAVMTSNQVEDQEMGGVPDGQSHVNCLKRRRRPAFGFCCLWA